MAEQSSVSIKVVSNRIPAMPAAIRTAVAAEVQKAAFQIEADAKSKVPVKTATLQRSIHTVMSNGGLTGTVGPSVFYGLYVEMGTRRMGARPFMRPAAEKNLPAFAAAVKAALGKL